MDIRFPIYLVAGVWGGELGSINLLIDVLVKALNFEENKQHSEFIEFSMWWEVSN